MCYYYPYFTENLITSLYTIRQQLSDCDTSLCHHAGSCFQSSIILYPAEGRIAAWEDLIIKPKAEFFILHLNSKVTG